MLGNNIDKSVKICLTIALGLWTAWYQCGAHVWFVERIFFDCPDDGCFSQAMTISDLLEVVSVASFWLAWPFLALAYRIWQVARQSLRADSALNLLGADINQER